MANKIKSLLSIVLLAAGVLAGCTDDDLTTADNGHSEPRELTGIEAVITTGRGSTRAGTVTPLSDYVGRRDFKSGDRILFTDIHRTVTPLENFTYPGKDNYEGITFVAGTESGWERDESVGPERVYWTDAQNAHTFIAYSIPQDYGAFWKRYEFTQNTSEGDVKKTYYIGAIGNPESTTGDDAMIDYYIDPYEKETVDVLDEDGNPTGETQEVYKYRSLINNDSVFTNPKLEHEDVVIAYDTDLQAEPGGSVALVKFYHALSSVRVVVNISGFAASSSAKDTLTRVSNMRLLHQPTMYIWMQNGWGAQALRAKREGQTVTDQPMVDAAWGGTGPAFDQRKDIRLWIPKPEGSGTAQSKTFIFYGITTPQPADYISTLEENDPNRTVELVFDVTYPDPMKPSTRITQTYKASLPYPDKNAATSDNGVHFEAGYNTTINISLNHKNEEMTIGAEYESWQFKATPDQSQLRKNSTFLQSTSLTDNQGNKIVTIANDTEATVDDATWLYKESETVIKDIYGHTGTSVTDAYQISTAYQLLSLAQEVKNGRNFTDKFIRLDADLTLQMKSDKTKEEVVIVEDEKGEYDNAQAAIDWVGIGDDTHPFNGTFIGGNRYIYRLKGSPLFAKLGPQAKIEQLNVGPLVIGNTETATPAYAVTGNGLLAESNEGLICGCQVVGDVTLSGTTAGAFVGTNSGTVFASYHVGATKGSGTVGGLVGTNSGTVVACYHAGTISGTTTGGIVGTSNGTLQGNYYNKTLCTPDYTPADGVGGKTSTEMTKHAFVEVYTTTGEGDDATTTLTGGINYDIQQWRNAHDNADDHAYSYQPANYPKLAK